MLILGVIPSLISSSAPMPSLIGMFIAMNLPVVNSIPPTPSPTPFFPPSSLNSHPSSPSPHLIFTLDMMKLTLHVGPVPLTLFNTCKPIPYPTPLYFNTISHPNLLPFPLPSPPSSGRKFGIKTSPSLPLPSSRYGTPSTPIMISFSTPPIPSSSPTTSSLSFSILPLPLPLSSSIC